VRGGTVDSWYGREVFVLISYAVCTENDKGTMGFLISYYFSQEVDFKVVLDEGKDRSSVECEESSEVDHPGNAERDEKSGIWAGKGPAKLVKYKRAVKSGRRGIAMVVNRGQGGVRLLLFNRLMP